jgi:hypothetical protein
MRRTLESAINAIARERGSKFEEASIAAKDLVAEYGEAELASRVADEVPRSVPWEVVADLLGILVWTTSDNGTRIRRQAEEWLREGHDMRKLQIALHLEAYPFDEREEMELVLEKLAEAHPEISERCRDLIQSRRKSPS